MREMQDSGIEWVGNIPIHWKIHPVYYYFGERKNKNRLGQENQFAFFKLWENCSQGHKFRAMVYYLRASILTTL